MMEDKELQHLFAFHMHRIKCAVFRTLNKKLVSMRLPVQMEQIPVLFSLYTGGDLSQQEIANITERDKSSIQRTIKILQDKQLVVVQQDQFDKRKNIVHITAEGKCVTSKIRKTLIEAEEEVFSAVEENDREGFFKILKRISDGVKE